MESFADKPLRRDWAVALIALLAYLLVLLFASWLDSYFLILWRVAAASFEYGPVLWLQVGVRLLMVAIWFGLAWLGLFGLHLPRLRGLLLVGLGLFALLGPFLGMLVGRPVIFLGFDLRSFLGFNLRFADFTNISGAFIAVLGLLVLFMRPQKRPGREVLGSEPKESVSHEIPGG